MDESYFNKGDNPLRSKALDINRSDPIQSKESLRLHLSQDYTIRGPASYLDTQASFWHILSTKSKFILRQGSVARHMCQKDSCAKQGGLMNGIDGVLNRWI